VLVIVLDPKAIGLPSYKSTQPRPYEEASHWIVTCSSVL